MNENLDFRSICLGNNKLLTIIYIFFISNVSVYNIYILCMRRKHTANVVLKTYTTLPI